MHLLTARAGQQPRLRVAAIAMGLFAAGYALLTTYYFWADWFRFAEVPGATNYLVTDRSGWLIPAAGYSVWTVLSPFRIGAALLTALMLGLSARSLYAGSPRARTLSLLTLWGLVLPQTLWYTELCIDWYSGACLASVALAGMAAVMAPTMMLWDGERTFAGWGAAQPMRLFSSAVALSWLGFAGMQFLDHSWATDSSLAYVGALAALGFAGMGVVGVYKLKTVGLWAGLAAALGLSLVPGSFIGARYVPSGGYIDALVASMTASDLSVVAWSLVPIAAIAIFTGPYLVAFARKARAR